MTGWLPCHRHAPWRLALILTATLAGSLLAITGTDASQSGYDYDCTDFESRADAQTFYDETGGPLYDPFNLDDDEDGIACEEWIREYEQRDSEGEASNGRDEIDRDCDDFGSQGAAQRYFLNDGGSARDNIDYLDPNHDGIACEEGEPG